MFEFLGWLLFTLIGLALSIFSPIVFLAISALGGGVKKYEFIPVVFWVLVGVLFLHHAYVNAPFLIVSN